MRSNRRIRETLRWSVLVGLVLVWSPVAGAQEVEEFTAIVVDVADGDTISAERDGKAVEIRLEGIDAPEDGQAWAKVARDGLAHAVLEKPVTVRVVGRDYYGRLLGRVFLGDVDINLELVKAGLAWHNSRYSTEQALADAQKAARKAKKGLWQAKRRPMPPWDYREARRRAERRNR